MDRVTDTCPGGSMRESHIRVRFTVTCPRVTCGASEVRLTAFIRFKSHVSVTVVGYGYD